MSKVLLPALRIVRANALATHWLLTPNIIMPALGFAHQLERTYCEGAKVRAVCPIYHDAQMLGEGFRDKGYQFQPYQYRGATYINKHDGAGGFSMALQPTASCNLFLSLILDVDGFVDEDEIAEGLVGGRFAGGSIVSAGKPKSAMEIENLLRDLPTAPAFWIAERQDLIPANADPLTAMLDALAPVSAEHMAPGWLMPATLGYAALTPLEQRDGVRQLDDGTPPLHVYAEALVGLIQFVSKRNYPEGKPFPFWRASWARPDVYLATQVS